MCFARHRLQAATLALRFGICRSAYPLGYTSWRTSRPARRKRNVPVLPMMRRCYLAGFLYQGTIRLCQPVKAYRFRYAFTERQTAHNGKRGKGYTLPAVMLQDRAHGVCVAVCRCGNDRERQQIFRFPNGIHHLLFPPNTV